MRLFSRQASVVEKRAINSGFQTSGCYWSEKFYWPIEMHCFSMSDSYAEYSALYFIEKGAIFFSMKSLFPSSRPELAILNLSQTSLKMLKITAILALFFIVDAVYVNFTPCGKFN
jgi:hypothetical protein